jgi:hypothetical protein
MTREELRAVIAAAIKDTTSIGGAPNKPYVIGHFSAADAALAAIEAAGVRLVPVDPDANMLAAGMECDSIAHPWEALGVYRQMLAASPYALKETGATEVFQELAKRQEPLGAEFEAAIGDPSTLYET